jgi:8-oxo-dGTP pyrophosphatase MutT (NUDIX family)
MGMRWCPDLTVAAIVARDDRFLVVEERINGQLVLNQPAGHVEDAESILAASIRETLEESAWVFTPQHLVGTYLWRTPRSGRTTLRFAFCGEVSDFDPQRRLDRGIVATHWLTRQQLASHAQRLRGPLVLRCIDDYLAGQRFELSAVAAVLNDDSAVQSLTPALRSVSV